MSRCCCKTAKHTTADTSVMEHTVPIDTNSFGAQTANTSNMEHRVRNDTNWFGAQTNEKLQRICRCEHCKVECKHANILRNNPVNILDPIRVRSGSAGKHLPEAGRMIFLYCPASGLDPFGPNLTQSVRTKSDPAWFCTIFIRDVCGRTEPSL